MAPPIIPMDDALRRFDAATKPCSSRATFPDGDGVHECGLLVGHINRGDWHKNEAGDHRWSLEVGDDGEPLEGMRKP